MNLVHETSGKFGRTHGMNNTRTYSLWEAMLSRTRYGHANYAGRGITVCDSWLKFENFYGDMGEAPEGLSLDRIDNNGNYEPSNCRWATRSQQNNNRRNNVIIEWNGKRQTRAQWERELNMKPTTLRTRLRNGWSMERAMQPLPADEPTA
jgi:hypothetical protein